MKSLVVALLLALPLSAQLTASVGPPKVPLGGRALISMSNDTPVLWDIHNLYPFAVYNLQGQPVFTLDSTWITLLSANEVERFEWNLKDNLGLPVAPGNYMIVVELPDGSTSSHTVTVGGVNAGVAFLGAPKLGFPRNLALQAPGVGMSTYVLAASAGTSIGIPTCAGIVPLNADGLFAASLNPTSPICFNVQGTFFGTTEEPYVWIPDIPSLVGIKVSFAFVVMDFALPCPVKAISGATTVTLQS